MLSKKKKVFVLVGMVALLVLTGVLNIVLNNRMDGVTDVSGNNDNNSSASFFASYKVNREETRAQSILYYEAIISSASSTAEAIANAETAKLELIANMELELVLEGLIKALGFEDAIVTNTTENINIIVKSAEINSQQAAQILTIITTETSREATSVRIIPSE